MADERPSTRSPVAHLSLPIPQALLDKLRERRASARSKRGPASPPDAQRKILSTIDIVRSATSVDDATELADAFVRGMNDLQSEIEDQYDAFLLDPGMGPMTYLTAGGRILLDHRTWDDAGIVFEASLDMAIVSLVVGATKTGISELLTLIPALTEGSICPKCAGSRYAKLYPEAEHTSICLVCFGRGEVDDRLMGLAEEASKG